MASGEHLRRANTIEGSVAGLLVPFVSLIRCVSKTDYFIKSFILDHDSRDPWIMSGDYLLLPESCGIPKGPGMRQGVCMYALSVSPSESYQSRGLNPNDDA